MKFFKQLIVGIIFYSCSMLTVASEGWSVEKLLAKISSHAKFEYRYSEIKHIGFLQNPLKSKGVLSFSSPDILQKKVTFPKKNIYKIIGDRLIISRENKPQKEVMLSNYPEMLALADSLRATFAGNEKLLKKFYSLELKGNRLNWKLTLTPIDIDLIEKIEFIEIQGKKGLLKRVVIKEVNGDRSIMTVTNS